MATINRRQVLNLGLVVTSGLVLDGCPNEENEGTRKHGRWTVEWSRDPLTGELSITVTDYNVDPPTTPDKMWLTFDDGTPFQIIGGSWSGTIPGGAEKVKLVIHKNGVYSATINVPL